MFTYDVLFLQQEVSPRTSGRLSHSSGPLNGSLSDSPPVSPSEMDDHKVLTLSFALPIHTHTHMTHLYMSVLVC